MLATWYPLTNSGASNTQIAWSDYNYFTEVRPLQLTTLALGPRQFFFLSRESINSKIYFKQIFPYYVYDGDCESTYLHN